MFHCCLLTLNYRILAFLRIFLTDIADIHNRIYLTRYPSTEEHSSYINAVSVDAFSNPKGFIVTQQPLPNTLGDFWRLVVEQNITVIVTLNPIDENDEVSL